MVTQLAVVPHGRQVRQAERQLRQQMLLVRREPFERASAGTKRKREHGEEVGGIEVASVIEFSKASGRVAACLFIKFTLRPLIL